MGDSRNSWNKFCEAIILSSHVVSTCGGLNRTQGVTDPHAPHRSDWRANIPPIMTSKLWKYEALWQVPCGPRVVWDPANYKLLFSVGPTKPGDQQGLVRRHGGDSPEVNGAHRGHVFVPSHFGKYDAQSPGQIHNSRLFHPAK